MKLDFIKSFDGTLIPADEFVGEKMAKFKCGMYEIEIKKTRNPHFHAKVFAFFKFCFDHWSANKTHWENMSEPRQFKSFRKDLTKLAGFTEVTYSIDGLTFNVEAKSLSFGSMEQDEFEECYNALINAAIANVFQGTNDENILNRLQSFF